MYVNGKNIYECGREFLVDLYEEIHGHTPPAEGIVIHDELHRPRTALEVVDLHINDAPLPSGGFDEAFRTFAFNLPNFSRFATVFPVEIRYAVADAILGLRDAHGLPEGLGVLDAFLKERATTEEIEDRRFRDRHGLTWMRSILRDEPLVRDRDEDLVSRQLKPLTQSRSWHYFTAGLREGLAWLARLSENASSFTDAMRKRLGNPAIGSVDAELAWQIASDLGGIGKGNKITWLGLATAPNFLKDAGLVEFVKPDVQTIRIIEKLGPYREISVPSQWREQEEVVFKEMIKIANEAGVWPRALDRLLWLIGSGNFHHLKNAPRPGGGDRADAFVERLTVRMPPSV